MGRRSKLTDDQRKEIASRAESTPYARLASEYGVSKTTVARAVDAYADNQKKVGITGEYGVSGLARFGGSIQDDYLSEWNSLTRMAKLIKRMQDHPIIASVLFAIEMTVRGAEWSVKPAGEELADLEAADFLESCRDDLSHTWDDHITQGMSMVPWGFAPFELVYKRRLGPDRDPSSKYDDGLIGWRKFAFRSQDTLAPGHEWEFDENGGVQAMNQQAPPDYKLASIPMEKMILYRTTSAKNNPQGRSMLRGAYSAWYFAKNFAEIEGISAERMGAGLPVMYLGKGTTKSGPNSDFEKAKVIVRDVRADEQSGIVIPHPEMTSDGVGAKFTLLSPPSKGIIDFEQAIQRYHQQIAQTLLAHFIFYGLTERGTQALAVRSTDFFSQALSGWLESIVQTLNRHAVSRLFALNAAAFPNVEAWPELQVGPIGQVDIARLVEAVSLATQSGLLHPDEGVERTLRHVLELPEREEPAVEEAPAPEPPEEETPDPDEADMSLEGFADTRGAGAQKLRRWERETNTFQRDLAQAYERWSRRLATDLANAEDEDEQEEILSAALAELSRTMVPMLRRNIKTGMDIGLGDRAPTSRLMSRVGAVIEINEQAIRDSLIPAIEEKVRAGLRDPDITATGAAAIQGLLAGFGARLESYAGGMWIAIQSGLGEASVQAAEEKGVDSLKVYWRRDPQAKHCDDCLEFGDREYESYEAMLAETGDRVPGEVQCDGNCYLPGTVVRGEFEASLKSNYSGPAREVLTLSGNRLAVTANHPILTLRGWLPANQVHKGDYAISYSPKVPALPVIDKHDHNGPAAVEDVFKALATSGGSIPATLRGGPGTGSVDLHGDAKWTDGKVDVVAADWKLLDNVKASSPKGHGKLVFEPAPLEESSVGGLGAQQLRLRGVPLTTTGLPCGTQSPLDEAAVSLESSPLDRFRLGLSPELDAILKESAPEARTRNSFPVAQLLERHPGQIFADQVVQVVDFNHTGHVYDLQTKTGTMIAQGIVASNCRCALEYEGPGGTFERFHAREEWMPKEPKVDKMTERIVESQKFVTQTVVSALGMFSQQMTDTMSQAVNEIAKRPIALSVKPDITIQIPKQGVTVNLPEMKPEVYVEAKVPTQAVSVTLDMPKEEVVEQEIVRDREGWIQRIVKRIRRE